uniref:Uncharacterized protein n=1 Tax=Anguilla anguilla TaxID=7936 RepID=A0A0E9R4K7_ANGAN
MEGFVIARHRETQQCMRFLQR